MARNDLSVAGLVELTAEEATQANGGFGFGFLGAIGSIPGIGQVGKYLGGKIGGFLGGLLGSAVDGSQGQAIGSQAGGWLGSFFGGLI